MKHYFKINPSFSIIQLPLSRLNVNILYEKSPIIINERIVYIEQLVDIVFKYLYISKKHFKNISKDVMYKNCARYAILTNNKSDSIVYLYHPNNKNNNRKKCLPVKLYKDQCIIIPSFWFYKSNIENTQVIKLYDIFNKLVSKN